MRVLVLLALAGIGFVQPSTVHVTVRLLDVRADKGGMLRVGVHSEPGAGFPTATPTLSKSASPTGPEATLIFDVPAGTYAVSAHHDENGNGKMDSNMLGVPKEGYGVSNDVRARFRPPRFSEAAVRISRDTTLVLHMTY
jgi:uncharacterized protein (DUF2141 family)